MGKSRIMKVKNNILGLAEIEPWHEPVDGQLLLDDLVKVLRRFVVLPKFAAETLALWSLHTYVFELREISTYIGLESPEKRREDDAIERAERAGEQPRGGGEYQPAGIFPAD